MGPLPFALIFYFTFLTSPERVETSSKEPPPPAEVELEGGVVEEEEEDDDVGLIKKTRA